MAGVGLKTKRASLLVTTQSKSHMLIKEQHDICQSEMQAIRLPNCWCGRIFATGEFSNTPINWPHHYSLTYSHFFAHFLLSLLPAHLSNYLNSVTAIVTHPPLFTLNLARYFHSRHHS